MTSRKRAARPKAGTAVAVVAAPKEPPAYMFNPGPEFSDRVRRDGAGIVNSGRFSVVKGSGGNAVLFGRPAGDDGGSGARRRRASSNPGAYRATACPAKCQCLEFQRRAACPHVLAAMIVRAGYGGCTVAKAKRRRQGGRGA